MNAPKPPRASEVRLDPTFLDRRDPVGQPMVDARGRAHVRRATVASQDRGRDVGRLGVDLDVRGTIAPDEIEQLCGELLAMRDAALVAQAQEDADVALADEIDDLATRCSLLDLRMALTAPSEVVGDHDREVVHAAIDLAERRAGETRTWGAS